MANGAPPQAVRILVVEDDRSTAQAMRLLLEHHHFRVDVAGTIAEAMRLVAVGSYDYALMDLMLPDGHGSEVFEWLRDNAPATKATILTGCGDDRIHELLDSIAPVAVIQKPVDFRRILERLDMA
jgi:two-component system response regulator RegA